MNFKKLFPDLDKDQLSKLDTTFKSEIEKIKEDQKNKYDSIKSDFDMLNKQMTAKNRLISKLSSLTNLDLGKLDDKEVEKKIEMKINESRTDLEKKEIMLKEYEDKMKVYEDIIKENNKQLLDKELFSQISSNLNNYPVKDREFVSKHLNMLFKNEYNPEFKDGQLILKDGKQIDQLISDIYNSEKDNDRYMLFTDNVKESGPDDNSENISMVEVGDQQNNYKEDIYTIS